MTEIDTNAEGLAKAEAMLEHFERLEEQFEQVRAGLTRSHRLTTLGTIATIIAHEYNNILTPIISYAQLALSKPDDDELMRKAVEIALLGSERAASISSSLLGFSRDTDEKQLVALLPEVVKEAVACLARDPKKNGIELIIDVPEVRAAMSPLNLQQVLLNLLLNANRAMRRGGGQLSITAVEDKERVRIDVADTGPGIPAEIIDRLFEPFVTHRGDHQPGPNEPKGTGLGLCICRDLVRVAKGTISVESEPGQGATFHIQLPKAADTFEST